MSERDAEKTAEILREAREALRDEETAPFDSVELIRRQREAREEELLRRCGYR